MSGKLFEARQKDRYTTSVEITIIVNIDLALGYQFVELVYNTFGLFSKTANRELPLGEHSLSRCRFV